MSSKHRRRRLFPSSTQSARFKSINHRYRIPGAGEGKKHESRGWINPGETEDMKVGAKLFPAKAKSKTYVSGENGRSGSDADGLNRKFQFGLKF
jgi:hypothetical protein